MGCILISRKAITLNCDTGHLVYVPISTYFDQESREWIVPRKLNKFSFNDFLTIFVNRRGYECYALKWKKKWFWKYINKFCEKFFCPKLNFSILMLDKKSYVITKFVQFLKYYPFSWLEFFQQFFSAINFFSFFNFEVGKKIIR